MRYDGSSEPPRWRAPASALLLPAMLLLGAASGGAATPVLTTVQAIRHLSPEAAAVRPQIHLRGVVTYYDTVAPNLFVQDDTGGIWVDLRRSKAAPPKVGQLLDLSGEAASGFSPYVASPRWSVLGNAAMPKPVHLSYEQAMTGSFDSQWVEMEGVVRSFVLQAEGSVLVMDVATPTGAYKVRVPMYHGAFPMYLVDAKVRFLGVCGTEFNRQNQIVGAHLMMPGMAYLKVLVPAEANPFALPSVPINSIRRFSTDMPDVHRVKVTGTVTARFPGQGLYLMDATGGVYVRSDDGAPVKPGDEAEVAGFPARGDYSPVLQSGAIHPTGRHFELKPIELTGKMGLRGGYDARLVRIRGTVESRYVLGPEERLVLAADDGTRFEAAIRRRLIPAGLTAPVGSVVELTGVCSVKADDSGNPAQFQIVMRTAADVRILSSPPWLNAKRIMLLALGLGVVALGGLAWVAVLRRQVRRQTAVIARDLEARLALEDRYRRIFERHLTGLFTAEKDGRLLECNEACAQVLGFASREAILSGGKAARRMIEELCRGVAAAQPVVNSEHHLQRPDGSWIWVLSNLRLVEGHGHPVIEGGLIDISDRKLADERIQFLAYYDGLTGLPNRALLQDRLRQAIARARRRQEMLAVLFLDVDWFKHINDSLGHSCGDRLLEQVADHLLTCAREQDTVARLGGDEFVVVLDGVGSMEEARAAAERLVRVVDAGFEIEGRRLNITCSVGVALFPEHGEDIDTLIKNADAAMYASKDAGRNRFSVFSPEMADLALERLTLENNLRGALERDEFSLVFQPVVSLKTGAIASCEALLRWNNAELGEVPPGRFIPIAERTGMIAPIGEWVLREACLRARSWQGMVPRVAVNVSEIQLRQEGFCDRLREILDQTGLAAEQLELELTEGLLVSRDGEPARVIEQLHRMGVRLAIDDFGTGYSSLGYLRQFPLHKVKIDRSFVRDLPGRREDASIVGAIISMARSLHLQVTAEGVESEAQMLALRQMGCDEAQGFHVCVPLAPNDLAEHLRAGGYKVHVPGEPLPA